MSKELEAWQSDPDYARGVELYRSLGGCDPVLLTLFGLPETSFTRKKLEDALEKILPFDSAQGDTTVRLSGVEAQEKTPKPVLDLIRKRSQLHEALFHQTSKSDRHKIALAILAIGKQLDRWYDHGQLPSGEVENEIPEPDIPINAWELHQLINNNLAYMAKNKNREDKQGEVKRRERMNIAIEERLKSINYETSGQST
jgi:hypothetical protein